MPGIGLDGGCIVSKDALPPKKKRKKCTTLDICPLLLCGLKGHETKRSTKCECHPKNRNCVGDAAASANLKAAPAVPTPTAEAPPVHVQLQRDAVEQDIMDGMPLNDEFCSADEFSSGHSSCNGVGSDVDVGSDIDDPDLHDTNAEI